jgi:small-conductance mechanosensitive channel
MLKVIPPRLRKPLLYTLIGVVFAAAWLIHGGRTWWFSIMVLVATAVRVAAVYLRAGKDTDEGALAGSRADERLKLLNARSRALAGIFAWVATFIALSAAVAAGKTWWPYAAILAVAGLGYLFGLSNYGVGEQDPAEEDADDAPSPVMS